MKILVVKHGALGDVVRTAYFAGPLRRKYGSSLTLFWITSPAAVPLIVRNPHIDRLCTNFDELLGEDFDIVYSLDDEDEVLANVVSCNTPILLVSTMRTGISHTRPTRQHGLTWGSARVSARYERMS